MTERPILFNGAMVRALRDGRKTVTRRTAGLAKINAEPDTWEYDGIDGNGIHMFSHAVIRSSEEDTVNVRCPYGIEGDRLWTREKFAYNYALGRRKDGDQRFIHYRSDLPVNKSAAITANHAFALMKWKPSIHMPRWASRDTLEVTSARPERLHAITEADAIAEGIEILEMTQEDIDNVRISDESPEMKTFWKAMGAGKSSHLWEFEMLWNEINGKTLPWEKNPWVWRVAFRRVEATA